MVTPGGVLTLEEREGTGVQSGTNPGPETAGEADGGSVGNEPPSCLVCPECGNGACDGDGLCASCGTPVPHPAGECGCVPFEPCVSCRRLLAGTAVGLCWECEQASDDEEQWRQVVQRRHDLAAAHVWDRRACWLEWRADIAARAVQSMFRRFVAREVPAHLVFGAVARWDSIIADCDAAHWWATLHRAQWSRAGVSP